MSRPMKTNQGSSTSPKSSGPHGSPPVNRNSPSMARNPTSMPHSSPSMSHTSHSSPKSSHSMPHGGQQHEGQSMPHGPPMQRGQQEGYSMPYGGYPPQGGPPPMGYGTPPPMTHGGFRMSPDRQSMSRGMYPMYGGPSSSSSPQTDNKNRMKTFSKTQRDNLSREGGKTGASHQRGAIPETMNRMTMDYKGRFIDSRGRVVDYSHQMDSSDDPRDDRYMYGREMPREEEAMYDYVMPGYMYGNMIENPDYMFDMDMPRGYPPFYGQYSDDDYNYGMMGNMMPSYMEGSGGYNMEFPGMHFPDSRRMDSAGRYGDSFDR